MPHFSLMLPLLKSACKDGFRLSVREFIAKCPPNMYPLNRGRITPVLNANQHCAQEKGGGLAMAHEPRPVGPHRMPATKPRYPTLNQGKKHGIQSPHQPHHRTLDITHHALRSWITTSGRARRPDGRPLWLRERPRPYPGPPGPASDIRAAPALHSKRCHRHSKDAAAASDRS